MSLLSHSALSSHRALPRWLPLLVVVALALLLRAVLSTNTDVSWGLTMAEKWLDGQRLYIDVIEVNPPATVFLYVLPVVIERTIGLRAETAIDALVFLAAAASLSVAALTLRGSSAVKAGDGWPLLTAAAAAILILPAQTFAEREHIVLIAFLPLLAVAATRAKGERPNWWAVLAAGISGGITAIVKPHFALAIVCVSLAAAIGARSWRVVFAFENWMAAAALAAYALFVTVAYPHYVHDMVPLLMLAYVPLKEDFLSFILLVATPVWIAMLALIWRLKRKAMLEAPFSLLLAASIGFAAAYFLQRKGWPYQSYPMLALALLALVLAVIERWREESGRVAPNRLEWLAGGLVTASIAVLTFFWLNAAVDRQAVTAAVRSMMAHPKILILSSDLSIGHPLTRDVGGIWVSRTSALWLTLGAEVLLERGNLDGATQAALKNALAIDKKMLTEDIAGQHPDLILVHLTRGFDWMAWAHSDPRLKAALAAYRPARTIGDVVILQRSAAH